MKHSRTVLWSVALLAFGALCATAQPPTQEQELGRLLYFDETCSINNNQACASCHHPAAGFADPRNAADPTDLPVSPGSIEGRFGGRNAPSSAYARFSPFFHWDGVSGEYAGGQFWDGRADTLAAQAAGPPTNPVEMALPDRHAVIGRLTENPEYIEAFLNVYGFDLHEAVVSPAGVLAAYDRFSRAIAEFEKTRPLAEFSSKFDYWMAGEYVPTAAEQRGFGVFNGPGKCSSCHIARPQRAMDGLSLVPPLFTDFRYDNLGLPVNPRIAELAGPQPVDYGLGGRADIAAVDPTTLENGDVVSASQAGKFKTATLRNIERTAPYGHNGFFATLEEIVHFYNTRDVLGDCALDPDPHPGVSCWPAPEVSLNLNTDELGNLGLTPQMEADLVAFLKTLTDGYGPPREVILPPAP